MVAKVERIMDEVCELCERKKMVEGHVSWGDESGGGEIDKNST